MMSSPSAVVCREIFDENSQPSAEEVNDYAQQLGIDPESESHLLPLARDGLMQALPSPWKAYYDEKLQTHYYYNDELKKTQWEHPLDHVYRELVKKARDASTQDDTCASVQELLTSEENTKNLDRIETKAESDDEFSTDSGDHVSEVKDNTSTNQISGPKRLTPSGRPPLAPLGRIDKKLGDLRISPLRRSIDSSLSPKLSLTRNMPDSLSRSSFERPKMLFKQHSEIIDLKMHVLNSPEEENFSPLLSGAKADKGLTLTGKGSMFLRVSKSDLPSPDTEKSLTLDSVTKSDPPKGILREKLSETVQRKSESLVFGKPKQIFGSEEDKKSVRFKLENLPEPTVSPSSNSSSEQNDGQSSIVSAPIQTIPSPVIPLTPLILSTPLVPLSPLIPPSSMVTPPSVPSIKPTPFVNPPLVLSPLVTRPPLPPRPQTSFESLKDQKNISGSEMDSLESESRESRGTSPKRRLLRPPAADYIKPDLFQKNFQKISDLVRPGDIEAAPSNLDEPTTLEKETRPRSPMIPLKNKISINLMESIESETSLDSPDGEFANLDLNDLNESCDQKKDDVDVERVTTQEIIPNNKDIKEFEEEISTHSKSISLKNNFKTDIPISQINAPKLDIVKKSKSIHSDSEDLSKTNSITKSVEKSPRLKIPHTPSLGADSKSPRIEFGTKPWSSPLSTFKPLNQAVITPLKSSDSATSLGKTSPRLDGVILSQGKSSSDNVVVVYQFETQENSFSRSPLVRSPIIPDVAARDMIERNKIDERKRLELSLKKELENIRMECCEKGKKMKNQLQEELKEGEEKIMKEIKVKLAEQADRHRREMDEALSIGERNHKRALEEIAKELDERLQRDTETLERQHAAKIAKMKEDYQKELDDQQRQLEIENHRIISELRDQLQASVNSERNRIVAENRASLESLKEEHASRTTELRQDYRAEVERLRTQHACHLEELRARLAGERAGRAAATHQDRALNEKYRCLKEKYARLKHDVKMSIERRNKRREMSMTTGSETEKSNSHKATQSLERCKEVNETSVSVVIETDPTRGRNNNLVIKCNDNETSYSESNAHKSYDNNNDEWKLKRDHSVRSAETSQSASKTRPQRRTAVAFREPPRRRSHRDRDNAAKTDYQDSSDATTADEKPKEPINGHGRRRCFTRLKSASTSRLNYSPKRGEGWSSPLEALRQQLRKLDDLEDQFPDLACQPAYSLRYPFTELGAVTKADTPEIEFVRHRALIEREGMRRARAVLKRRRAALKETRASLSPHRAPSEEREATELEVALHRARALLGEKEIRLRHIERALRRLADSQPPPLIQEATSDASSGSESVAEAAAEAEAGGAVLRSLRALHADVRDIWRALDARRPYTASPETSSCNAPSASQPRLTVSAEPSLKDTSDAGVTERARGLRAWLQTA